MAKRNNGSRNNQGMRNLRSVGWTAANSAARTADKAAVGLFRWATTDHSGMSRSLANMPSMGFFATIKYIFMQFLYAVAGAILTGVLAFLLIAGIQFMAFGHF